MRRKSRNEKRLDEARREREAVRREGEEQKPMVHRLERRAKENHFADLVINALRGRRA